jgi:hypothetical protein
MSEANNLSKAVNIFAAPNEAFRALKERPTALFPILVLIAGYAIVNFLYVNLVDLDWLNETQIRAAVEGNPNVTEAQVQQMVSAASALSPNITGAIGTVFTCIFVVVMMFLPALYLTIVSFATNDGIKLKQWFSLVAWSSLVGVISLIAIVVNLLTSDVTFMPQTEINPIAFASLLGAESAGGGTGAQIVRSLDFTSIWALILTILGYQVFTGRSLFKSAAIVLAPYVVIVAIVLAVTMS